MFVSYLAKMLPDLQSTKSILLQTSCGTMLQLEDFKDSFWKSFDLDAATNPRTSNFTDT